ncbi:hypothetical protein EMPS_04009 [Entomortierella parvispora]|uniref:Uncharacterized protein n=1 Tax=Entomortierella parvispora TaxID=205924 RepID=A0A9P3H7U1_9FUNG|nr:hypothetical protein EMPS_04009 [Entomortierella parvispora]
MLHSTSRSLQQQQRLWSVLLLVIALAAPMLLSSSAHAVDMAALDSDPRETPALNDLDRESDPSTGPFHALAAETHSSPSRFSTNRPHDALAVDPTVQQRSLVYQDPASMPISPPPSRAASREGGQEMFKKGKKSSPYHDRVTSTKTTAAEGSFRSPEPIVYQYTLYYPGNMPLVITAGHGGAVNPGKVVSRRMTHHFRPVSDLSQLDRPLTVESFSRPVQDWEKLLPEETMPWMPPRDQTKGGNFKRDLNTHAMALNLASAVSCLANGPPSKHATTLFARGQDDDTHSTVDTNPADIPPHCQEQGSWGDDVSEYPFPAWTTAAGLATTATPAPSAGSTTNNSPLLTARSQKRARRTPQKQYYPHVIVFRVHRTHVDVNRNITGENAIAEGSVTAEAAWREYHDLIDHVQSMVIGHQRALHVDALTDDNAQDPVDDTPVDVRDLQNRLEQKDTEDFAPPPSARGLLLDIHGHAHSTNLIEIGYLLDGSVLGMSDTRLDANARNLTEETSIRSLITYLQEQEENGTRRSTSDSKSPLSTSSSSSFPSSPESPPPSSMSNAASGSVPFSKWIRGTQESMGGMLQVQGLSSVPSPQNPSPCNECIYFFGGYTIQQHGTRDREDALDAIQLELPKTVRLVEKEEGREMGMRIGRAVFEYMRRYYDFSPAALASSSKGGFAGPLDIYQDMTPEQVRKEQAFLHHNYPQQHIHRHTSPATIPPAVAQEDQDDNSGDSENEQKARSRRPMLYRQSSSRL